MIFTHDCLHVEFTPVTKPSGHVSFLIIKSGFFNRKSRFLMAQIRILEYRKSGILLLKSHTSFVQTVSSSQQTALILETMLALMLTCHEIFPFFSRKSMENHHLLMLKYHHAGYMRGEADRAGGALFDAVKVGVVDEIFARIVDKRGNHSLFYL